VPRVSIITACRNSHEALGRIIKYYNAIGFPADIEWIIVDHCSEPKLAVSFTDVTFPVCVVRYDDCTPWIQATLFNLGASCAHGEYLMFLGIDSWVSPEWISFAMLRDDNFALFEKKVALLDKGGGITLLPDEKYMNSGVAWVSRSVFEYLGGFETELDGLCFEDTDFRFRYVNEFATVGADYRPQPGPISLGPHVFTSPEKGSGKRPDFLHREAKKGQDINEAEGIMNKPDRLRYFAAKGLTVFTE